MRCPNCGAEAGVDAKFCQRCGYSYDQRAMMPQQGYIQAQPQGMSKTTLIIIILIVVFVVVPVVLSAILYIMVLGFGGTSSSTPDAMYYEAPLTNGEQVTIVSITRTDVPWDDVKVQLNDGTHFAEWNPGTIDLDSGSAVTASYAAELLGTLSVSLTVTDVGGNGLVSGSDYFRLIAVSFDPGTTYSVVLVYKPTGESMGTGAIFMGSAPTTPAATFSKGPVTDGWQINIVSITRTNVPWDDIKIQLGDYQNFAEWQIRTADLEGGSAITKDYGSRLLGSITVALNVTDVGGNGFVSGSDYFRLTASPPFSISTSYTVRLVYAPTGEWIGSGVDFTG